MNKTCFACGYTFKDENDVCVSKQNCAKVLEFHLIFDKDYKN